MSRPPCLGIQKDVNKSYDLTRRWNTAAVVTDDSVVLGPDDVGPEAGMPVMEGKCVLFKAFGDVDAVPLCIGSKDVDGIVKAMSEVWKPFWAPNLAHFYGRILRQTHLFRIISLIPALRLFRHSQVLSRIGPVDKVAYKPFLW